MKFWQDVWPVIAVFDEQVDAGGGGAYIDAAGLVPAGTWADGGWPCYQTSLGRSFHQLSRWKIAWGWDRVPQFNLNQLAEWQQAIAQGLITKPFDYDYPGSPTTPSGRLFTAAEVGMPFLPGNSCVQLNPANPVTVTLPDSKPLLWPNAIAWPPPGW